MEILKKKHKFQMLSNSTLTDHYKKSLVGLKIAVKVQQTWIDFLIAPLLPSLYKVGRLSA